MFVFAANNMIKSKKVFGCNFGDQTQNSGKIAFLFPKVLLGFKTTEDKVEWFTLKLLAIEKKRFDPILLKHDKEMGWKRFSFNLSLNHPFHY